MSGEKNSDKSHGVLSDMADNHAEQPGDIPSGSDPVEKTRKEDQTEDAPRESD